MFIFRCTFNVMLFVLYTNLVCKREKKKKKKTKILTRSRLTTDSCCQLVVYNYFGYDSFRYLIPSFYLFILFFLHLLAIISCDFCSLSFTLLLCCCVTIEIILLFLFHWCRHIRIVYKTRNSYSMRINKHVKRKTNISERNSYVLKSYRFHYYYRWFFFLWCVYKCLNCICYSHINSNSFRCLSSIQ